jgi:1-acyl-sn-glycerol-3-phosphate acyltransferase
MRPKQTTRIFRILRFLIDCFFPAFQLFGLNRLPEEPCIIVGNHSQMNGPLLSELRLDFPHETWCAGELMNRKEAAAYAFTDFWSFKPRWTHPFFRLLSHLIKPIAVCLFNNAHTIPVYHDVRLRQTYRQSVEALADGESLVIFPEKNEKDNHILYAFQDKFVDTARFYQKKTGRCAPFVPVYVCPALKSVYIGKPTVFDPEAPIAAERERVCRYLRDEITATAESLPLHTVVPYRNIRKRDYPKNRLQETR